jgi:hypothetical protein
VTAPKLPVRLAALAVAGLLAAQAAAQGPAGPPKGDGPPRPEFPPYDQVTKGYEKVVSTTDGLPPLFTLWVDKKDGRILAELPPGYASKKFFIAKTIASGEVFAGLQDPYDLYVYFKRYGDTLALMEKDVETRSTGDKESKASVERLFTDRLIADTPIVTMSPQGGPVISLDNLLVLQAPKFFGFFPGPDDMRALMKFKTIKSAKAFPQNVEFSVEVPLSRGMGRMASGGGGTLKTMHYSISEIPDQTGYQPRAADDRVGYFTTGYDDLGKYKAGETRTRFINRWHLEKADPSLKVSPPKKPIVFYVEHTTPIRYRRFVKEGVLYWNKAFEKIGIVDAIEVYQQDAATGAYMDKDPEDVRYNFIRWLNNNISTAIGPSRVHPLTGQIIDADIVLTDGWIRVFDRQFHELLPQVALEGMHPETYSWLEERPMWDPRVALAPAHDRTRMLTAWTQGHKIAHTPYKVQSELEAILGRNAKTGFCMAANGKSMDLSLLMTTEILREGAPAPGPKGGGKDDGEDKLDGIPAKFVGPLLADLVAHEVGHTLGLRHNFAASGLYSLAEINSNKIKGQKPLAASVMDYLPVNINMKDGEVQGDYTMIGVGPYDMWAIEYGYSFESDLKPILAKASLPENRYATDQDTVGPDPLARRYDFSSNPLDYAKNQMKLAEFHRAGLIDKFVKDGKSWSEARRQYNMTLNMQMASLSMMARWVGGAHVLRNHKGDGTKPPVEAVTPAAQREALKWVIAHAFDDKAFGLTPTLLQHMKHDTLNADESFSMGGMSEGTYPVHDQVMGIQSSVLTMLMNPTSLRRVYDNEVMVEADKDAVTIPELLDALYASVWTEVDKKPEGKFTSRKPMISSTRRNLQRTYVERLIDLAVNGTGTGAASKPISNLAMLQLRTLNDKIGTVLKAEGMTAVDPYTRAHLADAQTRITKALDSQYILNARDIGGGGGGRGMMFFMDGQQRSLCTQAGCQTCAPAGLGWNNQPQK